MLSSWSSGIAYCAADPGTIPQRKTLVPRKMENGMVVDRYRRMGEHLLLTCRATIPTLIVLMTAVSCSDTREARHGDVERQLPPSGRLSDGEHGQLNRRSVDRQPILRREQLKTSARLKIARVHAPATTNAPVSRRVLEKSKTAPLPDAEKEQLFQEFLEWRSRRGDMQ
jgi:hypothetical protein